MATIKEYLCAIFIALKNQYYKVVCSYQINLYSNGHLNYIPHSFLLKLPIWISKMYMELQCENMDQEYL